MWRSRKDIHCTGRVIHSRFCWCCVFIEYISGDGWHHLFPMATNGDHGFSTDDRWSNVTWVACWVAAWGRCAGLHGFVVFSVHWVHPIHVMRDCRTVFAPVLTRDDSGVNDVDLCICSIWHGSFRNREAEQIFFIRCSWKLFLSWSIGDGMQTFEHYFWTPCTKWHLAVVVAPQKNQKDS